MATAAAIRKRPAPDEPSRCSSSEPGTARKKRPRYRFGTMDDYEKLEPVGEGTHGVVFKARHRPSGATVAVKQFRRPEGVGARDLLRAVVREAGCLAACRGHPSVIEIRDVAAADGDLFFLVTELVDGPCLRDLLTRAFSEAETRAFTLHLLRGLDRIHAAGVVHRDVKPENVLVVPGGATLKICDFGMATPARPPYDDEWVGSLWYRAPEQLMGSRCYGPGVDVWAVGCVMVELLTGEPLFGHVDTEEDMLMEVLHLRHEVEWMGLKAFRGLPELSRDAGEVLRGLLCFDEDQRLTAADAIRHPWFAQDAESPAVGDAE